MKRCCFSLLFVSIGAIAAPPLVPPQGLRADQFISHQTGIRIGPKHSVSQNIVGARSDEYSAINPGSSQARFLFNSTVMNASGQINTQFIIPSNSILVSTDAQLFQNKLEAKTGTLTVSDPFSTNVVKSKVHGMIFLKDSLVTSPKLQTFKSNE